MDAIINSTQPIDMKHSLDPTVIKTAAQLLELLNKTDSTFTFFLCDFILSLNWAEILKGHTIPGIEVLSEQLPLEEASAAAMFPGLYISNIKFTKAVHFVKCTFSGPVQFRNVIFEKEFQFFEPLFNDQVTLVSANFLGQSSFRSMTAKKSFSIYHSSINSVPLGFRSGKFEEGMAIYACTFTHELDLGDSVFKETLVFRMGEIQGKLNLQNCEINSLQIIGNREAGKHFLVKDINLCDTVVERQVQINYVEVSGNVEAENATFKDSVFIDYSTFKGNNNWVGVIFNKNLHIQLSAFFTHLSFAYAQFDLNVILNRTDFEQADISFADTLFNGDLWLGGNIIDDSKSNSKGKISFRGTVISANSIVRIFGLNHSTAPAGSIVFTNALIKGLVDIRDVYLNSISFDGTVVSGNIQDNASIMSAIHDRNTARLLKHEAKKINNTISALEYYRLEMLIHFKTLNFRQPGDLASLSLNYISNNFGLSWLRGVFFTITSSLLCYSLFIMFRDGFGFFWDGQWDFLLNNESFWAGFINFFWLPTGFTTLINSTGTSIHVAGGGFGAVFFILGKIMIAYGVYQIIAAFRKYL